MSVEAKEPDWVEQDPRPVVALPRSAVPGALIAASALLAAMLLFLALDAQRRVVPTPEEGSAASSAFSTPPPLALTPDTISETTVVGPVSPLAVPRAPIPDVRRSPIAAAPTPVAPAPPPPEPYYRPLPPLPPAALPQSRLAPSTPALVLDAVSSGIMVGTLIPAVLETPIDTSRPGLARAIVSEDVKAYGTRRVLVPRGSRLIGEYQSDVRFGQNRVLVNWTQLIRPDGLTIRMASPAADSMGGAGIPGKVNGFFLSRFFNAALQTALTMRSGNTVIVGVPGAASNVIAGQDLISGGNNRRKITIKQGTTFNVFVARELDFSGAPVTPLGSTNAPPGPASAPAEQQ